LLRRWIDIPTGIGTISAPPQRYASVSWGIRPVEPNKSIRTLRRRHLLLSISILVAGVVFSPITSEAAEPRPFYAGKTMTIVVGLPPGGGADAYARLVQRHYARYIPGRPSIVVQNLPGAGSLQSVMYLSANAASDGTVLGTFSSALLNEALIAPQRIRVDFRAFHWIGNVSEDVRVCYVWGASGVRTWRDLFSRDKELFMGATAPGTAGNADTAMLQNLFGVKLKQVQGYAGSADKRLAVERGEIDGDCGGWTSVPEDWLRERKINVLLRLSPTLVPGMDSSVPFGGDLVKDDGERRIYDFLTAPERLGRLFMMSEKVPADRVAILRRAFDQMVADPAFRADAQRIKLLVTPMNGDEVARRITDLYATPADIVARAKTVLGE
jgi:tripartite-type tricarboxylate transporter receptor subunit TctC